MAGWKGGRAILLPTQVRAKVNIERVNLIALLCRVYNSILAAVAKFVLLLLIGPLLSRASLGWLAGGWLLV